MKFLSEIYPNVKFFEKESDKKQIFYGVERSKLKKRVHVEDFVFIRPDCEFNTISWITGNEDSYYDALHINDFSYVLEKENVEELYRELVSDATFKNALENVHINNFYHFERTDCLPKEVHAFVLHFLNEMNHKNVLFNDADWEDSIGVYDGDKTHHRIILNEKNGYVYAEDLDCLVQEEASFKNGSFSSKLYLTTEGDLIQEFHSHSEKDLAHHMTVLQVIEGKEKEQYLQLIFKKEGN
ncbi:hypothetical protein bcgnr5378_62500 [Bacillus cereus]|uniref:Uncharacterized protein n=1 Tax=Bacillus cereus TaxID=1396 RepID=A0A150AZZ7_BACCE|nr:MULTISPECIES: hypothetical protein [Bacillus]HDR7254034.1 hypothetical protein [Bacillus pacificus]KAB7632510.1 hypothetical protein GBN96_25560 [Bacillus sp. B4-WWTP-NA-D-NA-NA]KXI53463.1 hypothetical protein ACS45_07655 [Bacillus cereus]KXX90086.1 hypothetical protein AT274_01635 [Bacillus cereus]MCU5473118.1 hypothetical protein [Bacillus paranthracis]